MFLTAKTTMCTTVFWMFFYRFIFQNLLHQKWLGNSLSDPNPSLVLIDASLWLQWSCCQAFIWAWIWLWVYICKWCLALSNQVSCADGCVGREQSKWYPVRLNLFLSWHIALTMVYRLFLPLGSYPRKNRTLFSEYSSSFRTNLNVSGPKGVLQ